MLPVLPGLNTHSNMGRHLEISLSCTSFSQPHLGPTNMAADGFNFCDPHTTLRLIGPISYPGECDLMVGPQ